MKEQEAIKFFRAFFAAVPYLLEKSDSEILTVSSKVYEAVFGAKATREYIRIALAKNRGNKVKRVWDLKQKYIVLIFLEKPTLTIRQVGSVIRSLFNQRTRPTVIESCCQEAMEMRNTWSNEAIEAWLQQTRAEYNQKSKDGNVLE